MAADIMKIDYVPTVYIKSSVQTYHSILVDNRWRQSVHSCSACPFQGIAGGGGLRCNAVHFGYCTPVSWVQMYRKRRGRRVLSVHPQIQLNKEKEFPVREVPQKNVQITTTEGSTNDSDFFLRKKEAELREKRERERRKDIEVERVTPTQENKQDYISLEQQVIERRKSEHYTDQIKLDNLNKSRTPVFPSDLSDKIPPFYFPMGRPASMDTKENVIAKIREAFSNIPEGKATKENMSDVVKVCGLPIYWKALLFRAAGGGKEEYITEGDFLNMWKQLNESCHDDPAKFVKLLAKPGCNFLQSEDFVPLIQDVVDCHPGLTFLQEAPEFHSRYVHTVISRIFYTINRSWSGKISVSELRKSNFLEVLGVLHEEEDINNITDYFSYEHFYVIYCKFWELDKDHDLFISKEDLSKHNDHAISSRMIDRIFSGAVTRGQAQKQGKMSYTEFVWFLISEEDKKSPTSIEYWFRCMDLDGDGYLSMYEMEYFYLEQVQKMESMGIETLPFNDCLCQMLDMVKPREEGKISLRDLKECKMTPVFFDTFFNIEKYLDHEQRDPFANARDAAEMEEAERSDWDRYAAEEYEILVAEEGAADAQLDDLNYEDDFEEDESPRTQAKTEPMDTGQPEHMTQTVQPLKKSATTDDIYDFSTKDLGY